MAQYRSVDRACRKFFSRFQTWLEGYGLTLSPFHAVSYNRSAIDSTSPYEIPFGNEDSLRSVDTPQNSIDPNFIHHTNDVFHKDVLLQFQILDSTRNLFLDNTLSRLSTFLSLIESSTEFLETYFNLNSQQ